MSVRLWDLMLGVLAEGHWWAPDLEAWGPVGRASRPIRWCSALGNLHRSLGRGDLNYHLGEGGLDPLKVRIDLALEDWSGDEVKTADPSSVWVCFLLLCSPEPPFSSKGSLEVFQRGHWLQLLCRGLQLLALLDHDMCQHKWDKALRLGVIWRGSLQMNRFLYHRPMSSWNRSIALLVLFVRVKDCGLRLWSQNVSPLKWQAHKVLHSKWRQRP